MAGEIHKSHRERMRRRFTEHGLDNFAEHEVLELMLFYCIPQGDVNPIAHELLNHFGSLASVLEASTEDLKQIKGIGEYSAGFLHLFPSVFRRYQLSKLEGGVYNTSQKLGEHLVGYFIDKPREQFSIVLLDNSCKLLRICEISDGSASAVRIDMRKLVSCVIQYNAAQVVLTHNHPRGDAKPSRADLMQTREIEDMLRKLNVRLVDHIVVAETQWASIITQQFGTRFA